MIDWANLTNAAHQTKNLDDNQGLGSINKDKIWCDRRDLTLFFKPLFLMVLFLLISKINNKILLFILLKFRTRIRLYPPYFGQMYNTHKSPSRQDWGGYHQP
ncbi:hypothetical protein, partial [Moraxella cuniculi]|uniref:hypothetical protein n=1 Tax=Moraxella cuniculi TaxID=34061 RepID=UPI001B80B220